MRALESAGSVFHPHNHYLFDPETGATPPGERTPPPPAYRKRGSLFYDVVHRHGRGFGDWMRQLRASWDELVSDTRLTPPRRLAFRAGGWDYGSTRKDLDAYLAGLAGARLGIHSRACP